MMNKQYSVNTLVEAQKIALDFRVELANIVENYSGEPNKQSDLLYGNFTKASNAKRFISKALKEGLDRTIAIELIESIAEGIKYWEEAVDSRIIKGSTYEEPYDPDEETFWDI